MMVTFKTLDSSIVSLIILFVLLINAYNRFDKQFSSEKIFLRLVVYNIIALAVDTLGWIVNGVPGAVWAVANIATNGLVYLIEPILASLWVLYTDYQVHRDENRLKKIRRPLAIVVLVNAAITVTTQFTHWFYYVDAANIYHRGAIYPLHPLLCFAPLAYAFFFVLLNKKRLQDRNYYPLLLFSVPVVAGAVLQIFIYGVSYTWSGMMLSLLIIYLNIQDRSLSTDYLTGLYNRRQFDRYIHYKVKAATEGKTFAAILVDLDRFKSINDRFGHQAGDEALLDAVKIIRQCVRNDDFAARYGGDEFFIILDIADQWLLEQKAQKLCMCAQLFNNSAGKPYKVDFSVGYDVYDAKSGMSTDEFIRHIDALMYKNKTRKLQSAQAE